MLKHLNICDHIKIGKQQWTFELHINIFYAIVKITKTRTEMWQKQLNECKFVAKIPSNKNEYRVEHKKNVDG